MQHEAAKTSDHTGLTMAFRKRLGFGADRFSFLLRYHCGWRCRAIAT